MSHDQEKTLKDTSETVQQGCHSGYRGEHGTYVLDGETAVNVEQPVNPETPPSESPAHPVTDAKPKKVTSEK